MSDIEFESDDGSLDANLVPFICELCHRENNKSTAIFKECYHLMIHTRKKHPTTCVGCYEAFESVDDMREHIRTGVHKELLICHHCLAVFPVEEEMIRHTCESETEKVGEKGKFESNPTTETLTDRSLQIKEEVDDQCLPPQSTIKSDDADYEDYQDVSSSGSVSSEIESEESDVELDRESGPFLCEICDVGNGESSFVFKERHHLLRHMMKRHPTVCPGCFQQFEEVEEMREHIRSADHDLPLCCACWVVLSNDEKEKHVCANEESMNIDKSHQRGSSEVSVKVEAVSESEESGSESEEESLSGEENFQDDAKDACLSCFYCPHFTSCHQWELRSHTHVTHPTVCCICFEDCDNKDSLECHQSAMGHNWWFDKRCKRIFIRRALYHRHVSTYHPQDCPFHCPYCDKYGTFKKSAINSWHIPRVHPEHQNSSQHLSLKWRIPSNMCVWCKERCLSRYSLLLHMFNCHNDRGSRKTHIFKCESCNLGFGSTQLFASHLKTFHSDDTEYLEEARVVVEKLYGRLSTCPVCDETLTRKFWEHVSEKHPNLRPHKCKICGIGFPQESDLRVHNHHDHNGPSFRICHLCNMPFKKTPNLQQHLRKKHDFRMIPRFHCFTHEKSFHSDHGFQRHFNLVHLKKVEVKNYGIFPCNICGKVFNLEFRLKYHSKIHEPREKVYCEVCGLGFATPVSLYGHKVKHTETYKCNICGKNFQTKLFLKRHEVVHSGEKPFLCELCGLRVSQKSALQRHVKVVHPDGKIKKDARAPSFRRSRGPEMKQRKRRGHREQETFSEDIVSKTKDADTKEAVEDLVTAPQKKCKGQAKRQRESSFSDSHPVESPVKEGAIGNIEMAKTESKRPHRKRRRIDRKSYRESSLSDDGVEDDEEEEAEGLDIPTKKRNCKPKKAEKKTPQQKKKRGRPPKNNKVS